jgi:chorismate mutase
MERPVEVTGPTTSVLDHLRKDLDDIDTAIVCLLNLRHSFALSARSIRRGNGDHGRDPKRERDIVTRITGLSTGYKLKTIRCIWTELFTASDEE